MKVKLQLSVFMLLINVSLAVLQQVTVMKGQALILRCPLTKQSQRQPVEWKNPHGVRDKRYSLHKLSESEFSIRISNVTFSDGGRYTCSHYLHHTIDRTVEVTVLDRPQMQVTRHEGKTVIKCTAEGNYPPPKISWRLKNGPEFHSHAQIQHEDKKFVSTEMLNIKRSEKAITVKCIVRHRALHSRTLMDFVKITPRGMKPKHKTTTTSSSESTLAPKKTRELTTETVPLTEKETVTAESPFATSPFSSTDATSVLPDTQNHTYRLTNSTDATSVLPDFTTTQNHTYRLTNSTDATSVLPDFTTTQNHTYRLTNSTGWTSVAVTTEDKIPSQKNSTENGYDWERQKGKEGHTSLLVFLVTCLIFGLLVVLIFIGVKLRRAHVAWKRENDDSGTSEESSKSKSSLEEKNSQAQKRRGLSNTALPQYVVQEPTVITLVTNPAAVTSTEGTEQDKELPTQAQLPASNTALYTVKETEL